VFTSYTFKLSACNRLGCTFSDSVTLSTATLPPHPVEPPSLYVLGTRFFKLTRVSAFADGPARRAVSPASALRPRGDIYPRLRRRQSGGGQGELSHESLRALVHLWTSNASSDRQSTALPNVSDWHICEIPVHSLLTVLIYNSGHFGPPLPFWLPMASYATDSSLKTFSAYPSHHSLPFLLQDWFPGFPGLLTNTTEHTRFLFFLFSTF